MESLKIIKKLFFEVVKNLHFLGVIGSFIFQSIVFQNKSILVSFGILSFLISFISLLLVIYPIYALLKLSHIILTPSIQGVGTPFRSFLFLLVKFHLKYILYIIPFIIVLLIGYSYGLFAKQDFNKPPLVILSTFFQVTYFLFLLLTIGSRDHKDLFKKFVSFFTQQKNRLLITFFFLCNLAQKTFWIFMNESTELIYPIAYGIYGLLILFNVILFILLTKHWETFYFYTREESKIKVAS
ncbi:hypothetical protein JWG45_05240 [Leptospira sp. 201903070]|uniref:Uncharacterized protein n=1 Tax=Leptospira ainlahdjerensis TaxID=2810033 RepID=A0ABS2U869_9LEPT|nr:hypothetical protein [Leptospira ainlahdjerensis]MBM9576555.1 hypothetical protein [Leptospira ainlahdjerensis]